MHWLRNILLFVLAGLTFVGCVSSPELDELEQVVLPEGSIILWHSLSEQQAPVLDNVINRFQTVNPGTRVFVKAYPSASALVRDYKTAANSGLGADIILTNSTRIPELADSGYIQPIDDKVTQAELDRFLATATATLRYDDRLYGLPASIDTLGLYYNHTQTSAPPTTVEQLLEEARAGRGVAMSSTFRDLFWGLGAYGVNVYDPQSSEFTFSPGGMVNWLTILQQARDTPGIILDPDRQALRQLFTDGKVAYYVGEVSGYPFLLENMGNELGLTPLPSGPNGAASPFLTTSAFLFNSVSTDEQADLALAFAKFATNAEQQAVLMRDGLLVPANNLTRVSPGLYPVAAAFEAQARTAVPYVNDPTIQQLFSLTSDTFSRVVEGLAQPAEAVAALTGELQHIPGQNLMATFEGICLDSGTLTVASIDGEWSQVILQALADGFGDMCPNAAVEIRESSPLELARSYDSPEGQRWVGDVLFFPHGNLRTAVSAGLLADITEQVDQNLIQALRPTAVNALRIGGRQYGIPISLDVQALYYDRSLVRDAAGTLDDLRTQATAGIPVVLDGTFQRGYWGVGAFGGRLFDEDDRFALEGGALIDWLNWLLASRDDFGIRVDVDEALQRSEFAEGKSAYYIGVAREVEELQQEIGIDNLDVTIFPEGPRGPGRPLMWTGGLAMADGIPTNRQDLALRFMEYAAGPSAQAQLMSEHALVPVNAGVDTADRPLINMFLTQAQDADPIYDRAGQIVLGTVLEGLFTQVIVDNESPEQAVAELYSDLPESLGQYAEQLLPEPVLPPTDVVTPTLSTEQAPAQTTPAVTGEATPIAAEETPAP